MDMGIVERILLNEGIMVVFYENCLKEKTFPGEDYFEAEEVTDGWKLSYIKNECKGRLASLTEGKVSREDDAAAIFLLYELEKYFSKKFYHMFYMNHAHAQMQKEYSSENVIELFELCAVPLKYLNGAINTASVPKRIMITQVKEEWKISYIHSNQVIELNSGLDYDDAFTKVLEYASKLYLMDLFVEKQKNNGILIRDFTAEEMVFFLGAVRVEELIKQKQEQLA